MHNSQSCDTVVQTDWHNFVWAKNQDQIVNRLTPNDPYTRYDQEKTGLSAQRLNQWMERTATSGDD